MPSKSRSKKSKESLLAPRPGKLQTIARLGGDTSGPRLFGEGPRVQDHIVQSLIQDLHGRSNAQSPVSAANFQSPGGFQDMTGVLPAAKRHLMEHFECKITASPSEEKIIRYTGSELREMRVEEGDHEPWCRGIEASGGQGTHDDITPEALTSGFKTSKLLREEDLKIPSKRGKLKGSRPECFLCHQRVSFWELDFCAPCLMAEAKKRDVPFEVQHGKKIGKNKKTPRMQPLSAVEVQQLKKLPKDTRAFCVGNRVSMEIMNHMLSRHGRQSHNPLIREYGPKYTRRSETPGYESYSVKHREHSNTSSTWSEAKSQADRPMMEHVDSNQYEVVSRSPGSHHSSRDTNLPPFLNSVRSPLRSMIGPRKPSTTTKTAAGIESDQERDFVSDRVREERVHVGVAGAKRKVIWETDYGPDDYDERKKLAYNYSAKRIQCGPSGEVTKWEQRSMTDYHSEVYNTVAEARQPPNEDWVPEVLESILQMEMAARPDSARKVGFAVKKELEERLMDDIVNGSPDEGRPISVPLLRALNAALGTNAPWRGPA